MKDRTVNIVLIVALVISTGLDVYQFIADHREEKSNTVTIGELNKSVTRYQACEKREEDLTSIIDELVKEMTK
jgi:hypothetical protein